MKDVPFVNRRYTKRGTFSVKNGIEKGKAGLDLGAEHHRIKLCWVLPPGLEWIQFSTTFSRRALALSLYFQRSNAFHLFWNNGFEIEQFFSHFFKWFSVEVPQYSVLLINTIVFPLWHKCCKVMMSILWGDFHSTQNPGEFGWYIKWNGAFRFGLTGILGTSFGGALTGLVISVGRTEMSLSIWQNCCPQYPSFCRYTAYKNNKHHTIARGLVSGLSNRTWKFCSFKPEFFVERKAPRFSARKEVILNFLARHKL